MRKKRSIVYVQPGKDVTLYVPAETPPEVIDYLNQLKKDGTFSQGVMEMITEYVTKQKVHSNVGTSGYAQVGAPLGDDNDYLEENVRRESALSHLDEDNGLLEIPSDSLPESPYSQANGLHRKLDMAQIFLQAQRNAGKMNLD